MAQSHCDNTPGSFDDCRLTASPQTTKPTYLGYESADNWQLPSTSTITVYYYYSARKLMLIVPFHGW